MTGQTSLSSDQVAALLDQVDEAVNDMVEAHSAARPCPKNGPSVFAVLACAMVCHEANRAFSITVGDYSHQPWSDAPAWQKESAMQGVRFHYDNQFASPSDSHDNWMAEKIADGWVYGKVKDPEAKTHPFLKPYNDLPQETKAKDHIFRGIVRSFIDAGLL